MKRLPEAELADRAVKFAGEYIEKSFKSGNEVTKSLVLNTVAHGYFMGARWVEGGGGYKKWMFWKKKPLVVSHKDLIDHSIRASSFYIHQKKYHKLEWSQLNLIRAALSHGFEIGARAREQVS